MAEEGKHHPNSFKMKQQQGSPQRNGGSSQPGSVIFRNIKSIEYYNYHEEQWNTITELAQDSMVTLLDWHNMRMFAGNHKWGNQDRSSSALTWEKAEVVGYNLWTANGDLIPNPNPSTPAHGISFLLRSTGNLTVMGESPANDPTTHIAQVISENHPSNKYLHLKLTFYSQTWKAWITALKKCKVPQVGKFEPEMDKPAFGKHQKSRHAPQSQSRSSSTSPGVLNPGLWFKDSMKSVFEFWDENQKKWVTPGTLDCDDFRFTMKHKTAYYYVAAYNENLRGYTMYAENNDAVQCQAIGWTARDIIGYGSDEVRTTPGSLSYAIAFKIKNPGIYSSFGAPSEDMLQQHRVRFERNCHTAQRVHELIRDELASSLDEPEATIWVRFRSSKPFPKSVTFVKEEDSFSFLGSGTENLPMRFQSFEVPRSPDGRGNISKMEETSTQKGDTIHFEQPERPNFDHGKQGKKPQKGKFDNSLRDWARTAEEEKSAQGASGWQNESVSEQKVLDEDAWAVPPPVPELIDWDAPIETGTTNWDTSPPAQSATENGWDMGANTTVGAGDNALSNWEDQPNNSDAADWRSHQDLLTGGAPSGPKNMHNNNSNSNNNNHKSAAHNSNYVEKKADHFDAKRARKPRGPNDKPQHQQYPQSNGGGGQWMNSKPPPSPSAHNKSKNNNKREMPPPAEKPRPRGDSVFSRTDVSDRAELISLISSSAHHRNQSNGEDVYKSPNHDWESKHMYDSEQLNGTSGHQYAQASKQRNGAPYLDDLDMAVNGVNGVNGATPAEEEKNRATSSYARDKFFQRSNTLENVDQLQQRRKGILQSLRDIDEQLELLQQKMDMQDELWKISLEISTRRKKAT